jgi:hypothetical protein
MQHGFSLPLSLILAMLAHGVCRPPSASAQPKLDIILSVGGSTTTYVDMLETGRIRDTFPGWQIGLAARLTLHSWFFKSLLSFNRWAYGSTLDDLSLRARVNSFELPLLAGYIPYQNPYFKIHLYGGLVNHFNTRLLAWVTLEDGTRVDLKFRPKEVDLAIYQALARFGANFDLAMFNVDFNYSISMNSAATTSQRVGYHQLQLNIGYMF